MARRFIPGTTAESILQENHEVRARGGARPLSFGQLTLSIPNADLARIKAANPELSSPDKEIQIRAWKRFADSPAGRPYLVTRPRYVRGFG